MNIVNPLTMRRVAMKALLSKPIVNKAQRFVEDRGRSILSTSSEGVLRISSDGKTAFLHYSFDDARERPSVMFTTVLDLKMSLDDDIGKAVLDTFDRVTEALRGKSRDVVESLGAHVLGCAMNAQIQNASDAKLSKVMSAVTNAVASFYAQTVLAK